MGALESIIADLLVSHHLDLIRLAAALDADLQSDLDDLANKLQGMVATVDLAEATRTEIEALVRRAENVIAASYGTIAGRNIADLNEIAGLAVEVAGTTAGAAGLDMAVSPPVRALSTMVSRMLIDGAPTTQWWSRQATAVRDAFAREVRQGYVDGRTTADIVRALRGTKVDPGILAVAKRQADALVRSSLQVVANAARMEVYQRNADVVHGVRWIATLDSRTCLQCAARDGAVYDLNLKPTEGAPTWSGGPGAIHPQCRCVVVPIVDDLSNTEGQRASMSGPVPASLTFDQWLSRKTSAFQDEVLGKGRAELYRSGDLTLNDLLSLRGNPLTLAQLRQKYGS